MLAWLERGDPFPPVERALKNPNGLLAAGAELSVERLLEAYRRGIFPWYSSGQPPLWWSPDPRMVLECEALKVSRSLAKSIRNKGYEVRIDTAFPEVLRGCAEPRKHEPATWLGADQMARSRHLRARHPARQIAARVGCSHVELQYGMRQIVQLRHCTCATNAPDQLPGECG